MTSKRILLTFVCAIALGGWTRIPCVAQEIAPLRQVYDGSMRPDLEVRTFARTDELFPVRTVERGSTARKLSTAKTALKNVQFEAAGRHYDLFDYLALNRVVGLLILKNGE